MWSCFEMDLIFMWLLIEEAIMHESFQSSPPINKIKFGAICLHN